MKQIQEKLVAEDVGWIGFGDSISLHYVQVAGQAVCGKRYRPDSVWPADRPHGHVCASCQHGYLIRQMHPYRYRRPCSGPMPTVTPSAITAGARRAALEEAEQICRDDNGRGYWKTAGECADAIKALKEKP